MSDRLDIGRFAVTVYAQSLAPFLISKHQNHTCLRSISFGDTYIGVQPENLRGTEALGPSVDIPPHKHGDGDYRERYEVHKSNCKCQRWKLYGVLCTHIGVSRLTRTRKLD